MAYKLTLTLAERNAIDWIGDRYSNGQDLYALLCNSDWPCDWDAPEDMTFDIAEHIAWQIRDNAEQEDGFWPCFADSFAEKMQRFIDAII